jgi:hypothetical protein
MQPTSTMVSAAVDATAKEELRKPRAPCVDFRINETAKKRLAGKTQAAGAAIATERKSAVGAALGKFLDDSENGSGDEISFSNARNNGAPAPTGANEIKKRPSTARRAKDDLGPSEHSTTRQRRVSSRDRVPRSGACSGSINDPLSASEHSRNLRLRKDGLSTSEHNPNGRKDYSSRVSRSGDDSGKLGNLLDQMSSGRTSRKGARSVASTPAEQRVHQPSSRSGMTSTAGDTTSSYERMLEEVSGEEDLKSFGGSGGSVASIPVSTTQSGRDLRSGRKKTDRERAASPGPIMKKRSESPGPLKRRAASPGPLTKRSESLDPAKKRSESLGPLKNRSASPGPLKKRSESPGPLKKRSESPGPMKKRSHSPGALSRRRSGYDSTHKMRSERVSRPGDDDGALGSMLDQVAGGKPKKKGARSVASAPVQDLRKPERRPSGGMPQKQRSVRRAASGEGKLGPPARTKSADAVDILGVTTEMGEYDWQGYRPHHSGMSGKDDLNQSEKTQRSTNSAGGSSRTEGNDNSPIASSPSAQAPDRRAAVSKIKRSFSAAAGSQARPSAPSDEENGRDMRNELAKQRVRRNNSMGPQAPRDYPTEDGGGESEGNGGQNGLKRAQSMMLHREMTRRGKSNSLADLVQYKEEEIHSTSYFASNHVLINRERMKRGLRPLTRNITMDEQARKSAEAMASSNGLNPLKTTYVGNVLRGESIRSIHRSTMQQKQGRERANLLNPYFQDFGVGTAKGEDGMLYMCQLFSERLELALTDTTSS